MSLDLAAEREWVCEILRGLNLGQVYNYLPANTGTPCFRVMPDSPYLSSGQTYKTARLHLQVVYVGRTGANASETAEVDTAISAAVSALIKANVSLDGASGLLAVANGSNSYLGASLNISFTIDL